MLLEVENIIQKVTGLAAQARQLIWLKSLHNCYTIAPCNVDNPIKGPV